MNKLTCKNCGYSREHLSEYEDYICPICNNKLQEEGHLKDSLVYNSEFQNETISLDEVIKLHALQSFIRDIKKMGKERVWNTIEHLHPAKVRARYRYFYFLALKELEKDENEL